MRQGGNRLLDSLGAELIALRPHLTDVVLQAGQVLCEPGDEIRHVYFLHEGAVSKVTAFVDGGEVEAALVGREGAVGAMAMLGMPRAVTRDVCQVGGCASRIRVGRLREAFDASQRVRDVIDRYLLWKLSCAIRNGACNARHSVQQRLSRWLLTCCDVLEGEEIALSQDVFAKMLGVQRTSVNPILQELKAAGAVKIGRSRVRVSDRDVLLVRACECYEALRRDHQALFHEEPPRLAASA